MTYRRRRGLRRSILPQGEARRGRGAAEKKPRGAGSREARESEAPGNGRRWVGTGLLVAGLFGLGYLAATLWLPDVDRPEDLGPLVTVPELVGLADAEAKDRLQEIGLEYGIRSTVSNPRAPEGAVLAQSPIPGQQVRPGAPVEVTLSRGPERHSIPDVAGLSERQATILLERLGFRVTSQQAQHASEAGRAIRTEPAAGTELAVPTDVTLLISKGSPLTTVPDLSGRHIDDALELLSESGLELGAISYDPLALDAPGRIVGQYPPGGYALRRGDPVEIRVAGEPRSVERSRSTRPSEPDSDGPEEL
jgi:beta-lactam-binding protein with PASTA domain